jgi:hypothetical protein
MVPIRTLVYNVETDINLAIGKKDHSFFLIEHSDAGIEYRLQEACLNLSAFFPAVDLISDLDGPYIILLFEHFIE